jgi:hypothetical protein
LCTQSFEYHSWCELLICLLGSSNRSSNAHVEVTEVCSYLMVNEEYAVGQAKKLVKDGDIGIVSFGGHFICNAVSLFDAVVMFA